jgi:DNA-binding NarL/FixJ family response regulator
MPSRPVWHRSKGLVRGDHAPRYRGEVDSYVVEPQSLFVPYLSDVLAGAELRVVRVAPTLDVEDMRASHPEALFVDTDFLDVDPADAVSAMREALPRAFICAYTDGEGAERLRFAGANCVLSKRSGAREITSALRTALSAPAG